MPGFARALNWKRGLNGNIVQSKRSKAVLAAAAIATGVFGFSATGRIVAHRSTQGSACLVKMEVLPDVVDSCTMPDADLNEKPVCGNSSRQRYTPRTQWM